MRVKALLLAVVAVAALSACGNDDPGTPGANGTAGTATGAPAGNAQGRDGCLMGTWKVDVNDMGQQTAAKVGSGAEGSGTGTLTVVFGSELKITYANAIVVDVPVSSMKMNMKSSFEGDAVSTDWAAKDGKLSGSMNSSNVKNSIVTTVGGVTVPASTAVPLEGSLDLAKTVAYTCSGNNATISGPGVVWKMTKA